MKLKCEFVIDNLDGKTVAIPIDDKINSMIMLNSTASFAMELLKTEITKEELIDKMEKAYEVNIDELTKDIDTFLEVLRNNNLLTE